MLKLANVKRLQVKKFIKKIVKKIRQKKFGQISVLRRFARPKAEGKLKNDPNSPKTMPGIN